MFNGIIQEKGTILKISGNETGKTFTIQSKKVITNKKIGDSIAIDGVCLTITHLSENSFDVDLVPETLQKTRFLKIQEGQQVNLEAAIKMGDDINGHLSQGHIDTVGTVKNIQKDGTSQKIEIEFPVTLGKYMALKGSITINGVSLTISNLLTNSFEVTIIPMTQTETNLGNFNIGETVNLEVDMIARYLESMMNDKDTQVTYDFLKERGFL